MKSRLLVVLIMSVFFTNAQVGDKPANAETVVKGVSDFGVINALRDIQVTSVNFRKKLHEVPNKFRRFPYVNADAYPRKEDPVQQKKLFKTPALSPIEKWDGMNKATQGATPPDPSGASSKNHYIQMVNTAMQIYDKSGNSLWGPTSLSSVFPGSANDGDPIVMYDKFADRWFISQFQTSGNKILIAISQTSDPLGSWYYYTYSFSEFPDYPKYSIWSDGYYMTANMISQNAVCFEREKMLAGDASAKMVALTVPDVEDNSFFSASSAHADGDVLPPLGTPAYIFYFQDDAWSGGVDEIKVWEMKVDWQNASASTIVLKQEIPVAAFNTDFDQNWNDLAQPNTTKKLDAVPGAFMYMGQFRNFSKHNSMLLSHTVDVDLTAAKRAGVRWYELRQNTGSSKWEVFQQGTFAPEDGESRWMGCIAMDRQGNIGMAYSRTSTTTFPSLYFTGRKKDDPLGVFTINESVAFTGTASQTNSNRFGDYAQMTVDPSDGLTFWYTGEYIGAIGWKTGVFSFRIGEEYTNDLTVERFLTPEDGALTGAESIKVVVRNVGSSIASNFNISANIKGDLTTELCNRAISPGDTIQYVFNNSFDFSIAGDYEVLIYSDLTGDEDRFNDTLCSNLFSAYNNDIGVLQILSPNNGVGLGDEKVKVKLKNHGKSTVSNFKVSYSVDGDVVDESFTGSLVAQEVQDFEFSTLVDLAVAKTYEIKAFTGLIGDENSKNDTAQASVVNKNCNPLADCSFGDGISRFVLGSIDKTSGCSINGYSDNTSDKTFLNIGMKHPLKVNSDEANQYLSVWIDYNDNFVFEPSELVLTNVQFNNSLEVLIDIPSNAPFGEHLLRARTNWMSNSDDPCLGYDYGETEDYTVELGNKEGVDELTAFEMTINYLPNRVVLSVDGVREFDYSFELVNALGQVMDKSEVRSVSSFEKKYDLNGFSEGLYYFRVITQGQKMVKSFMIR